MKSNIPINCCDVENHIEIYEIRNGIESQLENVLLLSKQSESRAIEESKCYLVPSHKKGGHLLGVDGFLFNKNKHVANKFYWECNKRKHQKTSELSAEGCSSKAVTLCLENGEHVLQKISTHNHCADSSEAAVKTVRFELKEKASESRIKPCQVIQDVTSKIAVSTQPYLPNRKAVRKIISRVRRFELPKEPQKLIDLNIPDDLRKTISGQMFLLREATVGEDKVLIFSTKANISRLAQSKLWMGDGTFKTIPDIFLQLYTIHAPVGLHTNAVTVPLVYAIMTSKRSELYDLLFAHLNEIAYEFECELLPKFILTDFEIGAVNAFKREFAEAKMKGCYFHLGQSIYRKIQSLGLASKYGTDVEFSLKVRMVYALAFLPPSDIPSAFLNMKATADDSLQDFFLWFEENYVLGRIQRKRKRTRRNSLEIRSPPLFPPSLWSVHDNNENTFPRTTNQAESWHRRWFAILGAAHVGTHFLIKEMKKEEHKVNGDIERMIAGVPSAPKKKDFVLREQRIKIILSKINETDITEILRGLAYNLKF